MFSMFQTFSGNTALHIVCSLEDVKGQVEAVKMLMSRGGDPGLRNYENELPCQLVPVGPTGEKVDNPPCSVPMPVRCTVGNHVCCLCLTGATDP